MDIVSSFHFDSLYFWVKWVHILSATLLFGTGLGIAFFMLVAHLRGDPHVIAATARTVVIADACFTAPAVITQFVTGLWLMHILQIPFSSLWIIITFSLFLLIGACWLPVLWLQWKARNLAQLAVDTNTPLPPQYFQVMRYWFWLGWPAFISVIGIVWLMVTKPS